MDVWLELLLNGDEHLVGVIIDEDEHLVGVIIDEDEHLVGYRCYYRMRMNIVGCRC